MNPATLAGNVAKLPEKLAKLAEKPPKLRGEASKLAEILGKLAEKPPKLTTHAEKREPRLGQVRRKSASVGDAGGRGGELQPRGAANTARA